MIHKDYYILFSESDIGVHYRDDSPNEIFFLVSMTFPPAIEEKEDGTLVFKSNLKKNSSFLNAMNAYEHAMLQDYRSVSILIGFDFDVSGKTMAVALRDNLLDYGVPSSNIFYTPLTEARYLAVEQFPNTDIYKKFLHYQAAFRKKLQKAGIKKNVGFMKAMSLKYSIMKRGKRIRLSSSLSGVNPKGTSTATVVTRAITGEE